MSETNGRKAEQLYEQRTQQTSSLLRQEKIAEARPLVAEFHTLVEPAVRNLEMLDYPVPSGLIDYQGERRAEWTLYKKYDINFRAHLLADGQVLFEGSKGPTVFEANDLLNYEMQTDLRYYFPWYPNALKSINTNLGSLASARVMSNYGSTTFHPV